MAPTLPDRQEHRFPCDQCGADFRFSPEKGMLVCDHCGNTAPMVDHPKAPAIAELDFNAALNQRLPEAETEVIRVLNCPNCGAQVEFDDVTHSKECPFCATPVVTDTGTHRHIKPRGLLPFGLDEKGAREAMNKWLGSLWFAPNGLQEYARKGRKMQGVYVPYWTYDADTNTRYTGARGTVYYETHRVMVNGKAETRTVQKVRWTPVSGRVARWFDDVLVLASKSLPQKYTDALEPWDLSALEPYSPEFLAGFRAEGYTVALDEGFETARIKMSRVIERDVKFDIGGDRQQISNMDTQVSNVTFKHVLLPVWVAAYKYRGKTFRFVVNGRTGRVQGERPYSAWKIALAVIAGLIVVAGVGYFIAINQ
ncbi:primosomal protein N' (replication factor Y) - superfamily II helicase [Donghicola sp. C2-DW-16]|uniref:Primosomal protein N' (Replication factor Y) -superfamily II helicase n=1 Tax=Donghicola mangrovi TaxID=2729614 RepID=A0ABX2PCI2_9RHOB|nr:TFIIB-type zinc finger domain-containing protein [Donghicola mangrovi]NVO27176.1 primosomal protein N' (replication factor Y) - superfamily II helicase [Donghicola mangrovi]